MNWRHKAAGSTTFATPGLSQPFPVGGRPGRPLARALKFSEQAPECWSHFGIALVTMNDRGGRSCPRSPCPVTGSTARAARAVPAVGPAERVGVREGAALELRWLCVAGEPAAVRERASRRSADPLALATPVPLMDLSALALLLAPPAMLGEFIPVSPRKGLRHMPFQPPGPRPAPLPAAFATAVAELTADGVVVDGVIDQAVVGQVVHGEPAVATGQSQAGTFAGMTQRSVSRSHCACSRSRSRSAIAPGAPAAQGLSV